MGAEYQGRKANLYIMGIAVDIVDALFEMH